MKRFVIIQADPRQHREDILAVMGRNLPDVSLERLTWNTQQTPYGSARWWLARPEGAQAYIGVCGLFPRQFLVHGGMVTGAAAGDFAVDPSYRAFGPALQLQKIIQAEAQGMGVAFVYTVPNSVSEALILKAGYRVLGQYVKYVKVLRTEYKRDTFLPPRFLTRLFAKLLDVFFAATAQENWSHRPSRLRVETPEHFDERFDRFWARISGKYEIMRTRTAGALTWRFTQSSYQAYRNFVLCDPEREVLGYIVYYLQDNVCRVVDLLCLDQEGLPDCLLAEFLKFMRQQKAGSVSLEYFGHAGLGNLLKRFNFVRRPHFRRLFMVFCEEDSPLRPYLDSPDAWYMMDGDNVL